MTATTAHQPDRARRGRGRPTGETSDDIQRRIIDVALRHFLASGFEAASIMQIAREAEVSRQLIHQKFGNKERLFEAVMHERENRFQEAAEMPIDPGMKADRDALVRYAEAVVSHLLQPWRIELERLTIAGLHLSPEMARAQYVTLCRMRQRLANFLDRLLLEQGISGADTLSAADDLRVMLIGQASPVVQGMIEAPSPEQRRDRITGMIDRFLRGLGVTDLPTRD